MSEIDERAVEIALGDRRGAYREQTMREGLSALFARGWQLAPPGASVVEWRPIESLDPSEAGPLLMQGSNGKIRVAEKMTAVEDGSVDWIYARRLSGDPGQAIAFRVVGPTHFAPLPTPPKQGGAAYD